MSITSIPTAVFAGDMPPDSCFNLSKSDNLTDAHATPIWVKIGRALIESAIQINGIVKDQIVSFKDLATSPKS